MRLQGALAKHVLPGPPKWLWALSILWLAPILMGFALPQYFTENWAPHVLLFYVIKSSVESTLFIWAWRRMELGPRVRRALLLTGLAFSMSAVYSLLQYLAASRCLPALTEGAHHGLSFSTYLLGLAGILSMPMIRRRGLRQALTFTLDLLATCLGLAAVLFVLITLPQSRLVDPQNIAVFLVTNAEQVLLIFGLTILILKGVPRPSRRAFWLFVSIVSGNLIVVVLYQFVLAGNQLLLPFVETSSWILSICTLWAAYSFRTDVIEPEGLEPGPSWWSSFNPLPPLAALAISLMLLMTAWGSKKRELTILSLVMVLELLLVLGRGYLTAYEQVRRQRDEAEHKNLYEREKTRLVGQLAGGIAHWYNNLLAVVIGHAELGQLRAAEEGNVRKDLDAILNAADRAARLTSQLMTFSGKPASFLSDLTLSVVLAETVSSFRKTIGDDIELFFKGEECDGKVRLDMDQFRSTIHELMTNAVEAMPKGGELMVRLDYAELLHPLTDAVVTTESGHYLRVTIRDSGSGFPETVLKRIGEPFITTKDPALGAGLGLAAVAGFIKAHGGGMTIETSPSGSALSLYLPKVD